MRRETAIPSHGSFPRPTHRPRWKRSSWERRPRGMRAGHSATISISGWIFEKIPLVGSESPKNAGQMEAGGRLSDGNPMAWGQKLSGAERGSGVGDECPLVGNAPKGMRVRHPLIHLPFRFGCSNGIQSDFQHLVSVKVL
jgi:hypothetical protein